MFSHLIPTGRATLDGFPLYVRRDQADQVDPPVYLIVKDTPLPAVLATDLFGRFGAGADLAASCTFVELFY